jgi:hypothetical protein
MDLHPFRVGELYKLLVTEGFEIEGVYGDLEEVVWNGEGSYPKRSNGSPYDFFTYVARKRGS